MFESAKSSSIVNSFSTLLLEVWEKWDVRGMVLFSLTLQIVLSYLGWRRKYTINPFSKTILWFAYLGADWIAIATLGKLSGSYTKSPTTNVLRAYWAPLLLLHLGGPDTITAYAFEDNKFWIRHLLILVVKAIFVVYVICLSWTFSWLSFLSLPLVLAGIIKYVEKILCLNFNNSQKAKPIIFSNFSPQDPQLIESPTLVRLQKEGPRCSLRLISFVSSFSVVLLFFISIINETKIHFSRVDIAITGILLIGAIALELYAGWVMLSSNWAIFVAAFHHSPLKKKEKKSCGILPKINNDITEMWHKYMFTKLGRVQIPSYLMETGNFVYPVWSFLLSEYFRASRGENALKQHDDLRWSLDFDFDYSIILWHLATSVCYYQEHQDDDDNDNKDEKAKISKQVSDYMMYLLATCPALILPDQSKSFWLDHTYDELKDLLFPATDTTNATSTLLSNPDNVDEEEFESSDEPIMESLRGGVSAAIDIRNVAFREAILKQILKRDVFDLATYLKQLVNKWELIRDFWIEILVYAAVSSQKINHMKQLGEGIEYLSIIWLFVDFNIVNRSIEHEKAGLLGRHAAGRH
ncbi:hypothetical protein SLEP1_g54894 [Rubroshorea leprosula]|uniref:DUF4220 domain-containing protein n=1 Tax=Rubroshorea leprosula TaxID=152421 RepID=A0AAV5MFZ1_9ROSI|nr:hypothetical protein SLEP1_g54894 [Rubroshorea leprosula]